MRLAVLAKDRRLGADIANRLRRNGNSCLEFANAELLRRALRRESFDLLLLDWAGQDLGGQSLTHWVRAHMPAPPPVLILINDDAPPGVADGADGMVTLPLTEQALEAAVQDVLAGRYAPAEARERIGHIEIDHGRMTLFADGAPVSLTAKEYGLAALLLRNIGRPLSRAHIMELVWGRTPDVPSRTLDAHVSQIRRRLGLRPENGFRLGSVYGFGYLLERQELRVPADDDA
jgi:DNA-binding response OmpR family regulator